MPGVSAAAASAAAARHSPAVTAEMTRARARTAPAMELAAFRNGSVAAARQGSLPSSGKQAVPGAQVHAVDAVQVARQHLADFPEPDQADAPRLGHGPLQALAGTNTVPCISLRAVRSSAERFTVTLLPVTVTSISTVKNPVGCSISRRLQPRARGKAATCAATEPGVTQAVATLTAPSTPMASCTRCGMKVRVSMAPPCRAGGDEAHLRHRLLRDVAEVHARTQGEAQALDARLERRIGLQLLG